MCGRFTLRTPLARVAELFELDSAGDWAAQQVPRFNVAPSQTVAAIRCNAGTRRRELVPLSWGLVPHWADDPAIGNRMINARAETVPDKPAFRDSFRRRRCLIPADGFYEWQKHARSKQPFFIRLRDDHPFAFAGLWDRWDKLGAPIESCTIITTDANELLKPLHDRMPVILDREGADRWLAAEDTDPEALLSLLRPYPAEQMAAYPVSTMVNSPRHEDQRCIEPAEREKTQRSLF
jgi:putative SOS response-associated peptidase YedK